MPQLDFSVFPSQLFWLSISFFSMLFIMSKLIIPRIAEMINLRKDKIDGYLQKAAEIKDKAEDALQKYHQALQKATDEATQSLQKTQQDMQKLIDRKQADLAAELAAQIADGEKKIQDGKNKALQQVQEMSENLALDVFQKLGLKVAAADVKKAVQEVMKD